MIVYSDKRFSANSDHPNDDWIGNADWVIPDVSELAEKIKQLYPNFEFVLDDDGNISDVVETEPEPVLPAPPTNEELAAAIAELAGLLGFAPALYHSVRYIARPTAEDVPAV